MIRSVLGINFFGYIFRVSAGSQSVLSVLRKHKEVALMTPHLPFPGEQGKEGREKIVVYLILCNFR